MRFHSQNLNDKRGGIQGSKWRAGRCWLYYGKDYHDCLRLEWSFWKPRLSFCLELGEQEDAISIHFCIGLVNLYFGFQNWRLLNRIQNAIKRPDQTHGN